VFMGTVYGDLLSSCVRSICSVARTAPTRTLRFRGRSWGRAKQCIGMPCACPCTCPAQRDVEVQLLRRHPCRGRDIAHGDVDDTPDTSTPKPGRVPIGKTDARRSFIAAPDPIRCTDHPSEVSLTRTRPITAGHRRRARGTPSVPWKWVRHPNRVSGGSEHQLMAVVELAPGGQHSHDRGCVGERCLG